MSKFAVEFYTVSARTPIPDFSTLCTKWIEYLKIEVDSAKQADKRLVIVLIARKMASLFEFYKLKSQIIKEILSYSKIEIITEHAIPLVLYGASKDNTTVIIVDDLIVFGDTVETVAENVYALTGIESKIIAIASSKLENRNINNANLIYPNKDEGQLKKSLIPSFVAKCSWDIVSLKSPIDIEHTILKLSLSGDELNRLTESLEDSLKANFPEAIVYKVEHTVPYTYEKVFSFTVCFGEDNLKFNNDFNKLRFFIGKDCLRIVSYAPNIWDDELLKSDVWDFISPMLNKCRTQVRIGLGKVKSELMAKKNNIPSFVYERACNRIALTEVVWANYLTSFESITRHKDTIYKVISSIIEKDFSFELCIENLKLLIGSKLSKELEKLLSDNFKSGTVADTTVPYELDSDFKNQPLYPYQQEKDFDVIFKNVSRLSSGVDSALSIMFYKLWLTFGLLNNRKIRLNEDKIHYGTTFDHLYHVLKRDYQADGLLENIHKWIDSRIDLGIVVPKYEQFRYKLGKNGWRRYFRAGEREDLMVDIARGVVYNLNDPEYENKPIDIDEFYKSIYPKVKELYDEFPNQLDLKLFDKDIIKFNSQEFNEKFYCVNLWIYTIILGALKLEYSNSWQTTFLNDSFVKSTSFSSLAVFKI